MEVFLGVLLVGSVFAWWFVSRANKRKEVALSDKNNAPLFEIDIKETPEPTVRVSLPQPRTSTIVRSRGIADRAIHETPLAIIDFETTGLNAGSDRVVEISIVRIDPGEKPRLVLNTLLNPDRPVAATEIHGISDADVVDAPRFQDILGNITQALSGSVICAYNVYFDIKFLDYELRRAGLPSQLPHLCLMYMRPLIGLGKRCSLDDACAEYQIQRAASHIAAADAVAAAQLWGVYHQVLQKQQVQTFGELTQLKSYKFMQSFSHDPLPFSLHNRFPILTTLKSRSLSAPSAFVSTKEPIDRIHHYWNALSTVLADFDISAEEVVSIQRKRKELGLSMAELRGLHARAFADMIIESIQDKALDDEECQRLHNLHRCLGQLGWAPGQ